MNVCSGLSSLLHTFLASIAGVNAAIQPGKCNIIHHVIKRGIMAGAKIYHLPTAQIFHYTGISAVTESHIISQNSG